MNSQILNCTLKRSPQVSSTDQICRAPVARLRERGTCTALRVADRGIQPGVSTEPARAAGTARSAGVMHAHLCRCIVAPLLLCLSAWTAATAQPRPPGTWTAPYPPTVDDDDQPVTDALIKTRLLAAYALDPNVAMLAVDVSVDRGVVVLSGTVASVAERELAIEIARGTGNVRDVQSRIDVEAPEQHEPAVQTPPHSGLRLDAVATAAVHQRLLASPGIGAADDIHVCVAAGTVTLAGTVGSAAARALAAQIAANTYGVREVRNDLRIATRPAPAVVRGHR